MFVRRSSVGFAPIFGSVVNVRDLRALIDCLGLCEIGCAGLAGRDQLLNDKQILALNSCQKRNLCNSVNCIASCAQAQTVLVPVAVPLTSRLPALSYRCPPRISRTKLSRCQSKTAACFARSKMYAPT